MKEVVRCSNCGKCFALYDTVTACHCPYCGLYDEIEDDDTDNATAEPDKLSRSQGLV
jgi:phage FluMu protein Com